MSQGEQGNSPTKDTSSVGQPSPAPPTASEYLAKQARKAAKAARKAEKRAKRLAADPESTAPDMDRAAHRKQSKGKLRKQQEAAEREQKEAADRKQLEEAAAAEQLRKQLELAAEAQRERERQALDASIEELVAKRQALSARSNTSPSSSRAHGGNAIVPAPLPHQEGNRQHSVRSSSSCSAGARSLNPTRSEEFSLGTWEPVHNAPPCETNSKAVPIGRF